MDNSNENKERYSYEYFIENGISYEEYQAMPEDERRMKFPYGSISSSGYTIAITAEHHQATLEHEEKMTAELMKQEGLEINYELREKFPNSDFLPICYDDSIVGVDPVTQSIIYDVMYYGYLAIEFIEWSHPKYKDIMYRATEIIRWIKEVNPEIVGGKVPPTFILLYDENFIKYWDDLQYPGW